MPESIEAVKAALLKILTSKPIAYYSAFARVSGGVTSGVFLSQLFYWAGRGTDPEGWIYKTQSEWQKETGLTRWEQETARKRLKKRGIMEERLAGVPARLHYRVDLDRLIEILAQSSLLESHNLECGNLTNKGEETSRTSVTEPHELLQRIPESTAESEDREAAAGSDVVICTIHNEPMELRRKDGQNWYSHRLPDGNWCKGAPGDTRRRRQLTAEEIRRMYAVEGVLT